MEWNVTPPKPRPQSSPGNYSPLSGVLSNETSTWHGQTDSYYKESSERTAPLTAPTINISADTSVVGHNKVDEKLQYVAQGARAVL